jgi:hypothetical protein
MVETVSRNATDTERVFCKRCGRLLIGKKSRDLGYGPKCFILWKQESDTNQNLFDMAEGYQDGKEEPK